MTQRETSYDIRIRQSKAEDGMDKIPRGGVYKWRQIFLFLNQKKEYELFAEACIDAEQIGRAHV